MSKRTLEKPKKPLLHAAFIMDGNRRWADEQDLPTFEGHFRGAQVLKVIAKSAINDFGITTVSAFAFSKQNKVKRSAEEQAYLMTLLADFATEQRQEFLSEDIRLLVSGDIDDLPEHTQAAFRGTMDQTANNKRGTLNLCVNYGGQEEIVHAVNAMIAEGPLSQPIDIADITRHLYAPDLPEVDLMVRTGGEQRTNGMMMWSGASTEYYFEPDYWPNMTVEHLGRFVADYYCRDRRMGA